MTKHDPGRLHETCKALTEMHFMGVWLHPKTGVSHMVADHAEDVSLSPEKYGMSHAEVHAITGGHEFDTTATERESTRGQLIQAAAKKGWIRIRGHRQGYTLQLHGNAATKLRAAMPHISSHMKYMPVQVHDFATGFQKTYSGGEELEKDIAAGNVPDHSGEQAVGREASASLGKGHAKMGIPSRISQQQQRQILRQHLGQRAGIPDREVEERAKKGKR